MSAPTIMDRLGDALERMIQTQMAAYPLAWTDAERREAACEYLFGKDADRG